MTEGVDKARGTAQMRERTLEEMLAAQEIPDTSEKWKERALVERANKYDRECAGYLVLIKALRAENAELQKQVERLKAIWSPGAIPDLMAEIVELKRQNDFHVEACGAHQKHIDERTAENAELRKRIPLLTDALRLAIEEGKKAHVIHGKHNGPTALRTKSSAT